MVVDGQHTIKVELLGDTCTLLLIKMGFCRACTCISITIFLAAEAKINKVTA